MPYTPTNNPYAVGDPYMYDLKWITDKLKEAIALYQPLSGEFAELKEYVINYFNNLDVSDEINAKINSMVADGTFDEILTPIFEDYTETINEIIANQNGAIDVLRARMDTFEALEDGSTTGDAELADIRVAYDGVTYPTAGDAVRGQASGLNDKIANKIEKEITSFNLFNPAKATTGYYIGSGGNPVATSANYFVSDYIPITGGKRYYLQGTQNQGLAYYDANKTYLSYDTANHANGTNTSTSAAFIRFTGVTANINTTFLMDAEIRPYIINIATNERFVYSEGNVADELRNETKIFSHEVSTAAELCSAITAVAQFALPDNIITNIYLNEGTYVLTRALTGNVPNSGSNGLTLPNNCNLIGKGKGAIISLDLTGETASVQSLQSTLNLNKNNNLENITLIAKNCRYALHNDGGSTNANATEHFKNCTFIHEGNPDGNWAYPTSVGEGTCSNANIIYEDCIFRSPLRGYYLHNQTAQTAPSYHKYINCIFTGVNNGISFALESLNSGVSDVIELNGCTFNGIFDCRRSTSAPAGFDSNDFAIFGHGNNGIKENFYFTDGNPYYIHSDDIITFVNNTASTIPAYTPVKVANNEYVPLAASDPASVCIGIAIHDIAAGGVGAIRTGGYQRVIISNTVGTKIGIVNGSLGVITSGDPVGVVKYYNGTYNRSYMKLCI